ncbi:MAG: radical SAM protein [Proteobacteria bacterium]|nr:radical SAM protein [Pseudomonadota bacterium]
MTYSPFRHLDSIVWKRSPIQLTFFLTKRCNARCPFCFYVSHEEKNTGSDELSVSEIQKISRNLDKLLWLAFSGGEIFLRSDLVEITRIFYENNKPAIILLPTNGLLTEIIYERVEAILKECPKSTIAVKLSLDGPEHVHDKMRGVKGGYQKTLKTCKTLGRLLDRYANFELGINTVFCQANQDYVEETIDLVSTMEQVKTHTVSLIRGDVSQEDLKKVDLQKYKKIIEKLESNLKKKIASTYRFKGAKLKAAQDILQRRLIYETAQSNMRHTPCYAGRLNLVLTENGDLYPCEDFSEKMKFANIRDFDYNPLKILNTDRSKTILAMIENKGCCCTHECYFMTNILFNPAMYPPLLKEYLQL